MHKALFALGLLFAYAACDDTTSTNPIPHEAGTDAPSDAGVDAPADAEDAG